MQTISLENMRIVAKESRGAWRTWVIATDDGGWVSFWNGQRYPRLTA